MSLSQWFWITVRSRGYKDTVEESVFILQTGWKSQQYMGSECRRLLILAGVSKSLLYSHYKRWFAWGLSQTPVLRILFFAVTSSFTQKRANSVNWFHFVGHIRIIYAYLLCIFLISLDLSEIWESPSICESCTLTCSCNLGGSCIFENDGFICFSKFLLNHLLVYKWHSKHRINESAFLLCASYITSEISPHAHQFQLSDWYT